MIVPYLLLLKFGLCCDNIFYRTKYNPWRCAIFWGNAAQVINPNLSSRPRQGVIVRRPFPGRKLPYPEGFGPRRHIVALAADIGPTIMVAADLLHKECNAKISAFFSQTPDPFWFHTACTWPRLAAADDPVGNAFARLELQRAKGRFVRHEFDGGAD